MTAEALNAAICYAVALLAMADILWRYA